jgi:hypothetical protein
VPYNELLQFIARRFYISCRFGNGFPFFLSSRRLEGPGSLIYMHVVSQWYQVVEPKSVVMTLYRLCIHYHYYHLYVTFEALRESNKRIEIMDQKSLLRCIAKSFMVRNFEVSPLWRV